MPDKQRALVLQGGGALAAYEAGVYAALYFLIKKDMADKEDRNVFDVVAGTSGGAINGSIIVSHVLTKREQSAGIADSWKGSVRKLLDFWQHVASCPDVSKWGPYSIPPEVVPEPSSFPYYYRLEWPLSESSWISRWDGANRADNSIATGEAARRYYSAKEYLYSGAPNVFTPMPPVSDNRFFDDWFMPSNRWHQYDNSPLMKSIGHHVRFPIPLTSDIPLEEEKAQPRLLMVSVDVKSGGILTFDSYKKRDDGIRKSEYRDYATAENDGEGREKVEITYRAGIRAEHVMASSSVPIHYKYADVPVDYENPSKGSRKFWDGGLLSNTPLRELVQAHEDYWRQEEIPDLQVYIVNIWPNEKGIPQDHDAVANRRNDLTYQDKTPHEEKVAYLVRDYIDLAKKLIERLKNEQIGVKDILGDFGSSKHRDGTRRTYRQLIEKKVRITDVTRIQRRWDPDEVSYKWCDYSEGTIFRLIQHGFMETLETLVPATKLPDWQEYIVAKVTEESTDATLSEDDRLTGRQASLLTQAVSKQINV